MRRVIPFLLSALLGGCTVGAGPAYVVESTPPPPRHTYVQPRSGLLWVEGHWEFVGGHWMWHDGHWIRERPGYTWQPGVWIRAGGHYQWRGGHWERGDRVRRVRVRDHRY
jgi:hypothetical protein